MQVLNVHYLDVKNIGDRSCAPVQYFNFGPDVIEADIKKFSVEKPVDLFIIGGGTLISDKNDAWYKMFQLKQRNNTTLVYWGSGLTGNVGGFDYTKFSINKWLKQMDFVGSRDVGSKYPWVPCASCMERSLDELKYVKPKHEVVFYENSRSAPLPIKNQPLLGNNVATLKKALEFIASGEVVVSSSYHGVYWATLMGRKAIAVPFSKKFYGFKHPPSYLPINKLTDWRAVAKDAKTYPDALRDCRHANVIFYNKIMDTLNAKK